MTTTARRVLNSILTESGADHARACDVAFEADGDLPSAFAVSDLAAASLAAAGLALADLIALRHGARPSVSVDRRLASFWFGYSVRAIGWSIPPVWDAVAGDYPARDGWIRLHTNAPHHRAVALSVLGVPADRDAVAHAVRGWTADDRETAIVDAGSCAATMRSSADWVSHPQGRAVAAEPLVDFCRTADRGSHEWPGSRSRPLAGLRVLDLTRVIAGPVATRFLAGLGADVLRIDSPDWNEGPVVLDVTLGKRCARLDLRATADRNRFELLLSRADVLVHGYRLHALEGLGYGDDRLRTLRPGLIDIALDAYGWTGPWSGRRGFDSLLQMSSGIADAGMRRFGTDAPKPLPVQALDHATGYLMAAAVLRALTLRLQSGSGSRARSSLARTAALLAHYPADPDSQGSFAPKGDIDFAARLEPTVWGDINRLLPPLSVEGAPLVWELPATALGAHEPAWRL